jgi:hypothetical protein
MKFKYAAIILLTSFVGAPAAFSQQTQGSLGATSTGKIDLDLQVLDSVEINRLGDINLGSYGGANTGDLASSEAYCVYVNGGDDYKITPTSSNGAASDDNEMFHLLGDNDADEIMYTVKFAGAATGAAAASINKYGDASTSFKGSKLRDCNNADNAQLHIDISEQEIRNATTDTYQDTLILLVNPV